MATKKAAKKRSRRTVMYSAGGKKLYAVRDAGGKFKDIQQYARAHAADIKRGSAAEGSAAAKKTAKAAGKAGQAAKKAVTKRPAKSAVSKAVKRVAKGATSAKKAAGALVKRLRSAVARTRARR
jgi:hypothetical protein